MNPHSPTIDDAFDGARANPPILFRLRLRWALILFFYAVALLGGYIWLRHYWLYPGSGSWIRWAALFMLLELALVWRLLPQNHPLNQSKLFPTFGMGTVLTLLCGLFLFLLAGFLFGPRPTGALAWAPALIYTLARLVDFIDGYVARITNHETALGAVLDIEFDGLGVLIAVVLAIQYGQIPIWYLPLAFSRQLFIAGIWLRRRRHKPVYDLPPSDNRRIIAGFQTGFLCVILWPILAPPLTTLAAILFAIPLMVSFSRDWLAVSGAINVRSPSYLRIRRRAKELFEGWLPLAARICGIVLVATAVWTTRPNYPEWTTYLAGLGITLSFPAIQQLVLLLAIAILPFSLGLVGRLAALMVIALASLDISASGLHWTGNAWLFMAGVIVAHLGSGYFALWRPEEDILHRRFGERKPVEL